MGLQLQVGAAGTDIGRAALALVPPSPPAQGSVVEGTGETVEIEVETLRRLLGNTTSPASSA